MTIIPLTQPGAEPLTLAEAKAHLRLDGSAEDATVTQLIRTARDHLERSTGLCLISRRLRVAVESVSEDGVIQILKGPVQTLDAITLYDGRGMPGALSPSLCRFTTDGPSTTVSLPAGLDPARFANGLEIDVTAGYGEAGTDVPDSLRRALLLHVAVMFDYRGAVAPADQPAAVPDGYDRLLAPFLLRGL